MYQLTASEFNTGAKNISSGRVARYRVEFLRKRPSHPFNYNEHDDILRRHMMTIISTCPMCSGCGKKWDNRNTNFNLCECKSEWYCGDYCRAMYSRDCSMNNSNGKWPHETHCCFHYMIK